MNQVYTYVLVTRAASNLLVAVVGDGDVNSEDGNGNGLAVAAEEAAEVDAEETAGLLLGLVVTARDLVLAVVHVGALVVGLLDGRELDVAVNLGVDVVGVTALGGAMGDGGGEGGEGQDDGLNGEHFDGAWD